jgi:hypothetical protein
LFGRTGSEGHFGAELVEGDVDFVFGQFVTLLVGGWSDHCCSFGFVRNRNGAHTLSAHICFVFRSTRHMRDLEKVVSRCRAGAW